MVALVFLSLAALITIAVVIALTITHIQDILAKKKRAKFLVKYPEFKLLISEYMRLTNEFNQTWSDCNALKKDIDKWEERNHYLPQDKKIDSHIEELKKGLWELRQIQQEQSLLVGRAKKQLELFWATNFPNLKKEKRIMWWYWEKI